MAERVLGPTGSRRRRRFLLVSLLLVSCAALFLAGAAQAVHEFKFQLDGDVSTTAYTVPDGPNGPQIYDWGGNSSATSATPLSSANGLFKVTNTANTATRPGGTTCTLAAGCQDVTPNPTLVPSVFAAASFARDFESNTTCPTTSDVGLISQSTNFCTADDSTYATGSKDTLGIGNGGWQCNHDNNVNSKIDIMNGYTASYFTGANQTGDHIIYFGMEKNKNNGTNDVGVWLLQGSASCSAPSGHLNFTGQHTNKDVLVVSEFTQGGGVSSIKAFQWAANAQFPGDSGCIDSNDWPDPGSNAPGVVPAEKGCNGKPISTSNTDCKIAGGGDSLCGTTNAKCTDTTLACGKLWNDNLQTPWLTSDATLGVGHTVVPPDFYEGGINITKVFGSIGSTAPSCFNTVVPDTRSSSTITATLFDYVTNKLGECKTTLSTQQNFGAAKQIGTNGTISSGTDTATLTVTGTSVWDGTLTWYLCGPGVTSCDNTGVQVTSTAVHSTDNTTTYTSGTASLTSAGTYCWHTHFQPDQPSLDAGVQPADDDGTNECFTVNPRTPTLTTAAVEPVGLLSPTMCGGLADLNGDCASNSDPTPDNGAVFYGNTDIIGGKLDCNTWGSTVNAGTAGDGNITPGAPGTGDTCTLLGYNGTSNVTINVVDGVFQVADGTALPAIFPNPATPNDHTIAGSSFAWSTRDGRVDTNGDEQINADDCSKNVVNTESVLGANCGNTIPQGNGLVDLNGSGTITSADSCTTGCFLGHNVSSGFVVAGPVPLGGTIEDVATLSGTANNPDPANTGPNTKYPTINGGTKPADNSISWTLYAPASDGSAQCSTPNGATTPPSIQVSGDGTYGPVSYTTNHAGDRVGKYEFAASYPGEGPNTNAASPQVTCDTTGANGEQVTVTGSATSSSAQRWLPNDRVVLNSTAGTTLHGTLTVTLYKGVFGGTAGNCTVGTGVAVSGQSYGPTTVNPGTNSFTFNTTNSTFIVGTNSDGTTTGAGTDGTYFWLIHYVDDSLTSPPDRCETSTISHNDG